jgi:hypothetical protein
MGPANNDKLHLRDCTEHWTVEAWIKYEGPGGLERGRTSINIMGTEDEGFSLPVGMRGGWSFGLNSTKGVGDLSKGIMPWARVMGSPRGMDPNHDTGGILLPYFSEGYPGPVPEHITDNQWHHVAWQFRFRDQTNYFFIDGKLVRRVQMPVRDENRIVINNAVNVTVPFVVGGFPHSQDPPFHLNWGTFQGEIDEIRISNILRYPVTDRIAIFKQTLAEAGVNVPYQAELATDAAKGDVTWDVLEGELPAGLKLDESTGLIHGTPTKAGTKAKFKIAAQDESGDLDTHQFELSVVRGEMHVESLPPAFVGEAYVAELSSEHLLAPLKWEVIDGALPEGISLVGNSSKDLLAGVPTRDSWSKFTLQITDANGEVRTRELEFRVLPGVLADLQPDKHTVALFDWQGPDGKLIPDRMGNDDHTLTWTNMGGDRRVYWPGRNRKFPQFTGHGEHGFASAGKAPPNPTSTVIDVNA